MAGRYAQTMLANRDVRIFVDMFPNFVGTTGYGGHFANDVGEIMYPTPPTISNGNNTRFGFRQPVRADGVTPWWFIQGTGDAATEQIIVTEMIDRLAAAGIHGFRALYYPQTAHCVSQPTCTPPRDPWSKIFWSWFSYYLTSPSKSKLKFYVACASLQASYDAGTGNADQEFATVGGYLNLATFAAYWATLMQDSQYALDSAGVPFFGLYDAVDTWTVAHRDVITSAATGLGFSGVHYVQMNQDETQAQALGADLGGYNNGIGVGTQIKYSDQITKDRTYWAQGSNFRNKHVALAHMDDGRVARGPGTWWTDHATYSQAENHVRQTCGFVRCAKTKIPDRIITMIGGELAEEGEFFPTRDTIARGPNTPSQGIWLDAIYNVLFNNFPATYVDCYHAMDLHADITRTGGAHWTTVDTITNGGGSNQGAFKFQEHRNTTLNDTITIAPALNCTRIRVYGRKGVGFGTSNWATDGGSATLVDQSALSESYNQLLYDTGVLSAGLHSVVGTVVTGMSIDEFKVSISR